MLWATRDTQTIRERKIFWVLMDMNIKMGINHKMQLLPTIYSSIESFMEFKVGFHHVFLRAWADPMKMWHELSYLVINNVTFTGLESWLSKWCTPDGSTVEEKKFVT